MHEVCSLKEVLRLEVYVILGFECSINSLQFFQCVFEACLDSYPFCQFCKLQPIVMRNMCYLKREEIVFKQSAIAFLLK